MWTLMIVRAHEQIYRIVNTVQSFLIHTVETFIVLAIICERSFAFLIYYSFHLCQVCTLRICTVIVFCMFCPSFMTDHRLSCDVQNSIYLLEIVFLVTYRDQYLIMYENIYVNILHHILMIQLYQILSYHYHYVLT